jgi:hypothetical protein
VVEGPARPPDEQKKTAEDAEARSEPVLPAARSDLIDTRFGPDMPVDEPVTSGGDTNQWGEDEEEEDNPNPRRPNGER